MVTEFNNKETEVLTIFQKGKLLRELEEHGRTNLVY